MAVASVDEATTSYVVSLMLAPKLLLLVLPVLFVAAPHLHILH